MVKRLFLFVFLACVIPFFPVYADGFSNSPEAIEIAAKSVLMLEVYDSDYEVVATGSGFVIFDNKTLVTNFHVADDAAFIIAYSDDGYEYLVNKAFIADENADIAILGFLSPTDLAPLALNTTEKLKRAETVVAIGSPKGLKNTVSLGNISALFTEDEIDYIQFTAPISSGSSGGALFDDDGTIIGITSATYDDMYTQNINFAIHASEIQKLYADWQGERIDLSMLRQVTRSIATPTPSPTPRPTAKPTLAPTPKPTATPKISNLKLKRTGLNSVTLSWSDSSSGKRTYSYEWMCTGNSYYHYDSTTNKTVTINDLIPGKKYTFYVTTDSASAGSDYAINGSRLKGTLTLPGVGNYTGRGFSVNYVTLNYVSTDVDPYDSSKKSFTSVKEKDIKYYASTRDYFILISYNVSKAYADTRINYLWTLTGPDKQVYSDSYSTTWKKTWETGKMVLRLDSLLEDCERFSSLEAGDYRITIYINGQKAYTRTFAIQ